MNAFHGVCVNKVTVDGAIDMWGGLRSVFTADQFDLEVEDDGSVLLTHLGHPGEVQIIPAHQIRKYSGVKPADIDPITKELMKEGMKDPSDIAYVRQCVLASENAAAPKRVYKTRAKKQ